MPSSESRLTLPVLVVVTDTASARGRPVGKVAASAIDGGARCVWVRDRSLPQPERADLVEQLAALLHPLGGLVLASPPAPPGPGGADGLHLPSDGGWVPPAGVPAGRSCHSAADVARAAAAGYSWATLSPVWPTASKPGHGPALGPAALAGHGLPVVALGGIDGPGRVAQCLSAGATSVAVMGAVMGSEDPAATVAALLPATGGKII